MKRNAIIALVYWLVLFIPVFAAGRVRSYNTRLFFILGATYVLLVWCPPLIVKFVERRPIASLGLQLGSPLRVVLWAFGAFALAHILKIPEIMYRVSFLGETLESAAPLVSNYPLEILQQLLWVGFPEEIVFRGYLLTRFRESWGTTVALFLSAFLFGIGHLALEDPPRAIFAGLVGLVYGWAFLKTESVYASTLAHSTGNLFSGAIIRFILSR